MDARIVSNQVINSLQISVLKEVPSGNFNPGVNFLLKNISDDEVDAYLLTYIYDKITQVFYKHKDNKK